MEKSYMPKASEDRYCEWINLCTIRKTEDWESKVWIKDLTWKISEDLLSKVINADTYNGKKILRVYSSGHIFFNENKDEVYLVTTNKNWKIQHQFTWGSPLEEENKEVLFKEDGKYKFDLKKVRDNARIRTKNRTWVEVLEEYNEIPLVDWVLIENEENGEVFYKLVCLMHFIAKKYKWELSYTDKEYVIDWKWYNIDELSKTSNIAPNVDIVTKKALELLEELSK